MTQTVTLQFDDNGKLEEIHYQGPNGPEHKMDKNHSDTLNGRVISASNPLIISPISHASSTPSFTVYDPKSSLTVSLARCWISGNMKFCN